MSRYERIQYDDNDNKNKLPIRKTMLQRCLLHLYTVNLFERKFAHIVNFILNQAAKSN